jgi:hypothetical protein
MRDAERPTGPQSERLREMVGLGVVGRDPRYSVTPSRATGGSLRGSVGQGLILFLCCAVTWTSTNESFQPPASSRAVREIARVVKKVGGEGGCDRREGRLRQNRVLKKAT